MDLLEDLEVAGDIEPLEDVHTVTCATCHIPHDDSGRWEEEITLNYEVDSVTYNSAWDPNENGGPDQFDFCTSCHTFYNQDGVMVGSGSTASGTAPYYHNTSWYRTITSTHYDDPTTGYDLAENILEGYVIREDSGSPCFDCHGHELRTNTRRSRDIPDADEETPQDYGPTIHTQWASSRHGANLLEAKYQANDDNPVTGSRGTDEFTNTSIARVDAVMMAGREDEVGEGWSWTHYDWDAMAGGFSGTGRQGCQRCHTSTGTSNYAQDPSTYDPANNDFSHLANWPSGATSSSPQNEMLYCWGCHSNPGTGYLYPLSEVPPDADEDPEYGGIVEDYAGEGVIVTYPDIDHSNTCMVCHLGREIGENVNNVADFTNTGFVNSHYLAAGASVFGVSGYEYPGLNYANPAIYAHDAIGTAFEVNAYPNEADLAATDNDMGPCVGCHMTAEDGSHNFLPFELTEDGSAFEYLTPVCAECHTVGSPYEITPALIEEEEEGYEAAIAALNGALQEIGIFYAPDYPYFFQDSGFGGGIAGNGILEPEEIDRDNGIDDWVMNADNTYPVGQDLQEAGAFNMGAAFNMNLAAHDPGGFAHNRFYYKRLIWDSIDWADDFMFNDSVPTAIDDLETAGSIDAAQALHAADYLGDARPTAGPDRAAIPGLDVTTSF